jgi:hypothetical protein
MTLARGSVSPRRSSSRPAAHVPTKITIAASPRSVRSVGWNHQTASAIGRLAAVPGAKGV